MIGLRCADDQTGAMGKNFLDPKDNAVWRALLGVLSLVVCIGLAALILRL